MIVGHCVVCGKSALNPGKLRGFVLAHHTCPCGGTLRRGRGVDPYEPSVYAVPLPAGQVTAKAAVPTRGAADRFLVTFVALLGLLVLLEMLMVGATYQLGVARGRGDLWASALAARAELEALEPKVAATTQACLLLHAVPAPTRSHP